MVLSMLGHQGLVQGSWLGLLNAQTVCVVYILVFHSAQMQAVLGMLVRQGPTLDRPLGLLNVHAACVVYILVCR